jgi:hypothetical protein
VYDASKLKRDRIKKHKREIQKMSSLNMKRILGLYLPENLLENFKNEIISSVDRFSEEKGVPLYYWSYIVWFLEELKYKVNYSCFLLPSLESKSADRFALKYMKKE